MPIHTSAEDNIPSPTPPSPAGTESPTSLFARYVAAANTGNLAAIRDMIAPDVERSDFVGCSPDMDNATCLLHYIQTTIVAPQAHITVLGQTVQGDEIDAQLEVRSALYSQAGSERILGRDVVRVRDGKIVGFRFIPDFSDEPTARFFRTLGIAPSAPDHSERTSLKRGFAD